MITRGEIQKFVDQVVQKFHPAKVLLFGSYANGQPNEDSDVDLLVVMRHRGAGPAAATRIRLACPRSFPMDLIVRSPSDFEFPYTDPLIRQIAATGIPLYESDHAALDR